MLKPSFILIATILLFAFSHGVWAADKIYKCKNTKGNLVYGSFPCSENVETINSWTIRNKIKQTEELVIKQDDFGRYMSEGTVNEQAVTFMLDTGASRVSLPPSVAKAAKLYCQEQVLIDTANGSIQACSITIPKFKFGSFVLHNVLALIAPNLSQPLLGMNVLQQFKMAQEQGRMRITNSS
jgi:clan AA aspartic protease (TIGR02281 family)